jgi:hypothetical protein
LDFGGKLDMLEKSADKKDKSMSEFEGLTKAARAVVRAHHLRDRDEADDSDVSDAIAELENSIPRRRKSTAQSNAAQSRR